MSLHVADLSMYSKDRKSSPLTRYLGPDDPRYIELRAQVRVFVQDFLFFGAIKNASKYMLTILLRQEDLDPNIPLRHGKTALHIAAEQGHPEIVRTLILWFADLSLQTADGKTALQIAVEKLDRNMVELLLTKGARPDASYNNGTKLSELPHLHLKGDEGDSVRKAISSLLENLPLVDGPFKKGEHHQHSERPRRGG